MSSTPPRAKISVFSLLWIAGAIGLEYLAWTSISSTQVSTRQLINALASHSGSAVILAFALPSLMPARYRLPSVWTKFFLGVLNFFLPVVGPLGCLFAVVPALHLPKKKNQVLYENTEIPDLPYRPLFMTQDSPLKYAEGALADVLRFARDPEKRVSAVMALRNMSDQYIVPLLRIALKDPVDDVRLLAYSMLDTKDQKLSLRIQDNMTAISEDPESQEKFRLHSQIAQDYWELVFLGIAIGDVLKFSLKSARHHAEEALKLQEEPNLCVVLAKVALAEGDSATAEDALHRAVHRGTPRAIVLPYLAEAAFLQGDYNRTRVCFEEIDPALRERPQLAEMAHFWTQTDPR